MRPSDTRQSPARGPLGHLRLDRIGSQDCIVPPLVPAQQLCETILPPAHNPWVQLFRRSRAFRVHFEQSYCPDLLPSETIQPPVRYPAKLPCPLSTKSQV